MSDTHQHPHDHAPRPDQDGPLTYYQAMETAVRELLIDKGVVTAEEVRACLDQVLHDTSWRRTVVWSRLAAV